MKPNASGRYESEFPYMAPCGREMNYIRCDDLPIVFSRLLDKEGKVIEDVVGYGTQAKDTDTLPSLGERDAPPGLSGEASTAAVRGDSSTVFETSTDSRTTEPHSVHAASRLRPDEPLTTTTHTVSPPTTPLSLAYGGTLGLTVPFQPSSLCMLPASGRVYHPGQWGWGEWDWSNRVWPSS